MAKVVRTWWYHPEGWCSAEQRRRSPAAPYSRRPSPRFATSSCQITSWWLPRLSIVFHGRLNYFLWLCSLSEGQLYIALCLIISIKAKRSQFGRRSPAMWHSLHSFIYTLLPSFFFLLHTYLDANPRSSSSKLYRHSLHCTKMVLYLCKRS